MCINWGSCEALQCEQNRRLHDTAVRKPACCRLPCGTATSAAHHSPTASAQNSGLAGRRRRGGAAEHPQQNVCDPDPRERLRWPRCRCAKIVQLDGWRRPVGMKRRRMSKRRHLVYSLMIGIHFAPRHSTAWGSHYGPECTLRARVAAGKQRSSGQQPPAHQSTHKLGRPSTLAIARAQTLLRAGWTSDGEVG